MRSGLFLLFLALPSAALAAEDRYGPTRRPDPILTASQPAAAAPRETSGYSGQMLNWSNKAAGPVVQPAAPVMQPAPQAAAPNRLPTSLYDGPSAPGPAPSPAPAPAPRPAPQPAPPAAWQTAQPSTALPPPPSPQPIAGSALATSAYNAPRAYSVVREYGGTPDRIPPPPPQSAFTGREVALDPGLLSEPREEEDRPEDEEDIEQPRKPAAKDRK
jgi:hypothetical protein